MTLQHVELNIELIFDSCNSTDYSQHD